MFYKFAKYMSRKTYQPLVVWYLKKTRTYNYNSTRIKIEPGVFHPGLFFSTKFILQELQKEKLQEKTVLELGSGSGLISIMAARLGARVTATDISTIAIESLLRNLQQPALKNLEINVVQSDLFTAVPKQKFDFILINPPYYPKDATNEAEMAWFCGSGFDYFHRLFPQLGIYAGSSSIWMSLSQDCDLERISSIAMENNLCLKLRRKKRIWWEENFLFEIEKMPVNKEIELYI